jgi:ankyrin repeat protein
MIASPPRPTDLLAWAMSDIERDDAEELRRCLQRGAPIDALHTNGWALIHAAAADRAVACMTALIGAGADIHRGDAAYNGTALHWCVPAAAPDCARILLAAGADLHARDHQGRTPLHEEEPFQAQSCRRCLLAAGADPLAVSLDGVWADPDLVLTTTVLGDPSTSPATREHLRVHGLRHLGDQPALAARLLDLTQTRL